MTEVVLGPIVAMAALLVCISLGFRRSKRPVPVLIEVRSRARRR